MKNFLIFAIIAAFNWFSYSLVFNFVEYNTVSLSIAFIVIFFFDLCLICLLNKLFDL